MSKSKKLSHTKANTSSIQDGLFVPTVKYDTYVDEFGKKKRRITETLYRVEKTVKGGETSFIGLQLTAQHQSLLFGLAAKTLQDEKAVLIKGTADDPAAKQMLLPLEIEGFARDRQFGTVETTARSLMIDAGIEPNKAGYETLKFLLQDMSAVTVSRTYKGQGGSCSLLSASWTPDGHIKAVLNWGLSEAIMLAGKQFILISLHERHAIGGKDPVGLILHAWLSGTIRLGKSLSISIDKLIPHVWGNRPCTPKVIRNRRAVLKRSLLKMNKSLSDFDWIVSIDGDIVKVTRPKEMSWIDHVGDPSQILELNEEASKKQQEEGWADDVDYS